MRPLALSAVIFVLVIGSILLGACLRRILPQHHLDKSAQDIVLQIGVVLIATMVAIVLGLLVAGANSSYDMQNNQIKQVTADIILLDNLLAGYGPDAMPMRKAMRRALGSYVDRLWQENESAGQRPFVADRAAESIDLKIRAMLPQNEVQRSLKERALQVTADLEQTRLLLFVESGHPVPAPFLAIVTVWLMIIFASYSLFTSLNATTFTFLSLFALSAAAAIFLILELSNPFSGMMMIPSSPLRDALTPIGACLENNVGDCAR